MSEPAGNKDATARPAPRPAAERAPMPAQEATGADFIAVFLTTLWLLGAGIFFFVVPGGLTEGIEGLRLLTIAIAVVLPVAMIWVATTTARTARALREESARLQVAIDAMRKSYVSQQARSQTGSEAALMQKIDEIAAMSRKTQAALAALPSVESPASGDVAKPLSAAPKPTATAGQAQLELGTPAEVLAAPLERADFIRALNFPETAEDQDGFAALRRALRDRKTALLIQAAQDMLTLLSQDGIYMDDLRPDRTSPEIWRKFANGERGRAVAGLGAVRDRSSLALTAGRMKQDMIFRDTVHHFLRLFDKTFAGFEKDAGDADIAAFADTRTARAFMLLGRVAGTFD